MHVLGALLLLPLAAAKCPSGATEAYNQCYVPSYVMATWSAAEGICQTMGGHLAKADNAEQNAFLQKLISDLWFRYAWISPSTAGGSWMNSDGSPVTYTNFEETPRTPWNFTAAAIDGQTGEWSEHLGTLGNEFICQFPACGADGSMPPSILAKNNDTGVIYKDLSNSFFYSTRYQWITISTAETWCARIGGHLPAVSNSFQNVDLLQIINDLDPYGFLNMYAFGLYSDSNSVWHWTDGRSTGYTNWAPNANIAAQNQRSVFDKDTGKWAPSNDVNAPFMCQFAIDIRKC